MLPKQKTPPKTDLRDLSVLLYGPTKSGKSELCSHADNALFLATEPGLNHLEVYQVSIGTWDELLAAAKEIAEGKHPFRTIVIDTVDNAYRMCAEYVCAKFKIDHESDLEYGKGYSLVNAEFHRVINKLALLPYGLWLVSHAQDKEIQTRTGKYTKTVPTLPDKARKLVLGLVDIILFADLDPTTNPDGKPAYRRVLRTKPSAAYEAGDRTKRLPETIDFDFPSFAAAFARGARQQPATSPATATAATEGSASSVATGSGSGDGIATAAAPAAPAAGPGRAPPTATAAGRSPPASSARPDAGRPPASSTAAPAAPAPRTPRGAESAKAAASPPRPASTKPPGSS